MDIKAKIDEIVYKIRNDDQLAKKFAAEPVKTLEDLLGVDLPDEQIKALAEGVKAKLESAGITEKLSDLAGKAGAAIDDAAAKLELNEKAAKIGNAIGGLFGRK